MRICVLLLNVSIKNWWYLYCDSMFLITRWSKTWVINFRREDLMKKEANYLNIKCWNVVSILMLHNSWIQRRSIFRLVWDAIPTGFPVHNPPHPLITNRKTPTYRASPTQEPGSSVVVTIRCQQWICRQVYSSAYHFI